MAYPGQFHRLVMIGTLNTDIFNMSLNMVPSALGELFMPAVDDASLAGVAADVSTWFTKNLGAGGVGFSHACKLTSIKLNRIGTDGHYVDPIAKEHLYPAPISGPLAGDFAPQLSLVATLGTRLERGRGSKGRIYPPPSAAIFIGTDGRVSTANALDHANGIKALITSINTRYTLIGRVGVASSAGTGLFEHVTRVSTGRVVDTMRSRRNKVVEDYQEVAV